MATLALKSSFVQGQLLRRSALLVAFLLSGGNSIFPRVPLAALLIVICVIALGGKSLARREFTGCFLVLLATFVVAMLGADGIVSASMLIRFTNFILGLMVLSLYVELGRKAFTDDIYPLLKFMCYQSIATTALGTIVPGLFTPFYVNETTYNTIGLILTFNPGADGGNPIVRSSGFFFEPGVFQFYLNMFLLLAAFVRGDPKHMALGLIAVLCTQSTTGLAISAILMVAYFVQRLKDAPSYGNLLITILSPILLIPFAMLLSSNVEDKFFGTNRGSSWARQYDTFTGFAVAVENPLVGIGFDYQRYFEESYHLGYKESELDTNTLTDRPNSNGIVTAFYSLGFPLGLIFLFGLYRQLLIDRRLLAFALMFLSFSTEALLFTPFALMFVFSGLLVRPQQR
ncbi:MAG: hypothetical protein V4618_04800 [Pseudomonadota bacterium]